MHINLYRTLIGSSLLVGLLALW